MSLPGVQRPISEVSLDRGENPYTPDAIDDVVEGQAEYQCMNS